MDRTPQFKKISKFILSKTPWIKVLTPFVEGSYKLKKIRKYTEKYEYYEFEIEFTGVVYNKSLKSWKELNGLNLGHKRRVNDRIRSAVANSLYWYLQFFSINKSYYITSDIKKVIWV